MSVAYAILLNTVSGAAVNAVTRSGSIYFEKFVTTVVVGRSIFQNEIRTDFQTMSLVIGKTVLENEIRVDKQYLTLVLAA